MRRFDGTLMVGLRAALLLAASIAFAPCSAAGAQASATRTDSTPSAMGRITGRVLDAGTGRPLPTAQVSLDALRPSAVSDIDGRFELRNVPVGLRRVTIRLIGYRPARQDSIRVEAGRLATVTFSLTSVPTQLQAAVITADAPRQSKNDASLLAIQKNAASVSDGISAEAMQRAPSSNAADAITRVPGISVVGGKFTVVRGLGERYSNTMLNGAELPSPEPTRKIVPLDIFPASLLESIVTTKAATPDKPGDFAGGSVEIRTKDFPEEGVAQFSVSMGGNSNVTFQQRNYPVLEGAEVYGLDASSRLTPHVDVFGIPISNTVAQKFRSKWVPPLSSAPPDMKANLTLGNQFTLFGQPLGIIVAGNYGMSRGANPDRLFVFLNSTLYAPERAFVSTETKTVVDVGGILNISYKIRPTQKISFKNTYTRNTEDSYYVGDGYTNEKSDLPIRNFQNSFVMRELLQSQLSGDHLIGWLGNSRLEWRGTSGRAVRLEPDTRQAPYIRPPDDSLYEAQLFLGANSGQRNLEDRLSSVGADWSLPFRWRRGLEGQFKVGGLYRRRDRTFTSQFLRYELTPTPPGALPFPGTLFRVPPDQMFAPENIGPLIQMTQYADRAASYLVDERVKAAYGMLDMQLNERVRFVGGARYETWTLGLKIDANRSATEQQNVNKYNVDVLGSANLTVKISEQSNLRAAWFSSVTRPDPREVSPDTYEPVVGECLQQGSPGVRRTRGDNYDLRWETYPSSGEIISLSAFLKTFDLPIVETVNAGGSTQCVQTYVNATRAVSSGFEFEARRRLSFLPGVLSGLSAAVNFTLAQSRVWMPRSLGLYKADLALAGQSPVLLNGSLSYDSPKGDFQATALLNFFGDRIQRYGIAARDSSQLNGAVDKIPDVEERGRWSLDAKVARKWRKATFTIGARNLLDQDAVFIQTGLRGTVIVGRARLGISVSTGVGYEF
jgi:outer membrane receptor protein involved in Fe transport